MKVDTTESGSELTAQAVTALEGRRHGRPILLRPGPFRPCSAGRPVGLRPAGPRPACGGGLRASQAARRTGAPDLRLYDLELERFGRARDVTVLEVVNDNMPFLLDFDPGRDQAEQGSSRSSSPTRSSRWSGTRRARSCGFVGEATVSTRPPSGAKASSTSISTGIDEGAPGTPDRGTGQVYADVAVAVRDWPAMRGADRRDHPELPAGSAAAAGRRDRRGGRLPRMDARRQFHLPRRARIPRSDRRHRRRSGAGNRPRAPARSGRARCCGAAANSW